MFFVQILLASPGGRTGATLLSNNKGCGSCHSSSATAGVAVAITGPLSLGAGLTGSYTVTVNGTSGSAGGVDIAASSGTLAPVSSNLKLSGSELTHVARTSVPSTYTFTLKAPAGPGTVTLYATGKDADMNSWNWAPNCVVTITGGVPPPASPALTAPANGLTGQSSSLTFAWTTTAGATSYRLQVSADSLFGSTFADDTTITGVSKTVSGFSPQKKYFWRVQARNVSGGGAFSSVWKFTTGAFTAVTEGMLQPRGYELAQNYPNPFNPGTMISYRLPSASRVTLVVFDLLGNEIATLARGAQGAGFYSVRFDASHLASGIYLYRLEAESLTDGPVSAPARFIETRRLILLR
jgi:hypothetical protein